MKLRTSIVIGGTVLALLSFLSQSLQGQSLKGESKTNATEAARLNNLGSAYMNQQLFEKALKDFKEADALDPKLTMARLNQGIALLNLQKIEEAKAVLEDALKQDPNNANAWYNVGLLAKNTGDAQAAIDAFHHVTEIDPNDADTWYFLGSSYVQAKQFSQAIDAFRHALQLNPLHASAEFGLSRAYQQSAELDHARDHLKKFQYITQNKLGTPISLAYGEQGKYSRTVESPLGVLKAPAQIKVQFMDVTKEAGIVGASRFPSGDTLADSFGPGACFLDFDNDGRIDILLANNGSSGGVSLLHNSGGRFENVTRKAGLDPDLHATGCAVGDYDNDGFADIVLTTSEHVYLFHNEKKGTFKDVTHIAGIRDSEYTLGATFIDYDHDGDLDLYITRSSMNPGRVCFGAQGSGPQGVARPRGTDCHQTLVGPKDNTQPLNTMWRNDGNGLFTDETETTGLANNSGYGGVGSIGSDFNNDRAVDLIVDSWAKPDGNDDPILFQNRREGKFAKLDPWPKDKDFSASMGIAVLDFDHDGWMDVALAHYGSPGISLWRNEQGKSLNRIELPQTNLSRAYGVAAIDYDNDGWVDLVAVGETKEGKGEIKLFRNLGADGFKDVTADVGLDKIQLKEPRAVITGDYDNDGATDLLITQHHGPAVLLRNDGGNRNHWLRLSLKGLADNKSAIGTKVEVFAGGNRQKFEIYGSNGYLGQNSPYLTVGLGDAKQADIVRMLWPTGVLQDEINVAGDKQQNFTEMDRRGSSCPTLFVWNGKRYEFVADMLGAGVVGHWIGPNQRDSPRPVEYIKIDRKAIREKEDPHFSQSAREMEHPVFSFRFMEPLEEAVYLDQARLVAVDHPADLDVYPNEYFASNPPYPEFKVVVSRDARPPAGAWDDHGRNVLPDLQAHRYFGDFALTQFQGFAKPHTLTLDLGERYHGGPLWLLMHGEVEYFSANSMYAASQAGVQAIAPYVEALDANGKWVRVVDDMGFPAGGPRTMTADLTGKLPLGTRKIRITTNLQIYWDNILIDRTEQINAVDGRSEIAAQAPEIPRPAGKNAGLRNDAKVFVTAVPLVRADLEFHGYPLKIEGTPPGNVEYVYEKTSATGPYTRPAGNYTRYGDVLPLLTATDDKLAVFGSGDEVSLDFDPSSLPTLPHGWVRDYFFAANGYEKDMDFYAAEGDYVAPLPFLSMGEYPYTPKKSFPLDDSHLNYLLEYNTRQMSGNEQRGYWFDYGEKK
jgi:Tfp pilus assembly protein PilF